MSWVLLITFLLALLIGEIYLALLVLFEKRNLKEDRAKLDEERRAIAAQHSVLAEMDRASVLICGMGVVIQANEAAYRLFGYQMGELTGVNVKILMAEPYRSQHDGYLKAFRETGVAHIIGTPGRRVVCRKKNGSEFPADLTINRIVAPDGTETYQGFVADKSQEEWKSLSETVARLEGGVK